MTPVHFAYYHGDKQELEPVSYRDRNQVTVITCGTEGETSVLDPIVIYLQYYSMFYEDFVGEFQNFYFQYLGANYIHTYREKSVDTQGKYNTIFKYMMRLHLLYLVNAPNSKIQIFGRSDKISNLDLTIRSVDIRQDRYRNRVEYIEAFYTLPTTTTTSIQNISSQIGVSNLWKYYYYHFLGDTHYQLLSKHQGVISESYFDNVTGLVKQHDIFPFGLYDRTRSMVPFQTSTTLDKLCTRLPSKSVLVLTACRGLTQTMKTQVYRHVPSIQQVISKLTQIKLVAPKKRKAQQQHQQTAAKKKLR